ncbi:MAG: protein kinase [Deltaproteobacteria bacterium]|nr:protein kinase [Deltaproteobacteria bacterium]
MELHSLGGYRLVRPLPTRTSISRMYLARPEAAPEDAPATQIAKLLNPGQGESYPHYKAQFAHEANLLRNFSHPGIPSLRAAGTQDGVDYFITDYVFGVDLETLLGHAGNEPRGLAKELAVYIVGQVADALRYVHEFEVPLESIREDVRGAGDEGFHPLEVLHRDLCPANILLSIDGDVLLTDFGSASSLWLTPEFTAADAGHVAYKAPRARHRQRQGHDPQRPVLARRDPVGDAPRRALLQGRQRPRDHGRDRPLRHQPHEPARAGAVVEVVRGPAPQPRPRPRAPLPRRLQGAAASEPGARGHRRREGPARAGPAGLRAHLKFCTDHQVPSAV